MGLDDSWIEMDIENLIHADWNYKTEDDFMQRALVENIKRNGQVENLLIRPNGERFEVVNGNHRLTAMRELGFKKAVVKNLGNISLEEAKRIAFETNETRFQGDPFKMSALLIDVSKGFEKTELLQTLPITEEELNRYLTIPEFDFDDLNTPLVREESEGFVTLKFSLPEAVAEQFNAQLTRFKKTLYPQDNPKDVSDVLPIEAMIQCLAQTPDDQLV